MTGAEALIRKGRNEDQLEEARALLIRLGSKRLGEPDAPTLETLMNIKEKERLETLLERILDSETWQELLKED